MAIHLIHYHFYQKELIKSKFDFENLFVLDLANNHQGSVKHALKIIKECAIVVHKHNIRAAIKFQFRQYDSFIHPDHFEGSDNKHIPRFLSTELSIEDWKILFDAVKVVHGSNYLLTEYVDEYLNSKSTTQKTKDQVRRDLVDFSNRFELTQNVTRLKMVEWANVVLGSERGLEIPTRRRIVSSCRGYWR